MGEILTSQNSLQASQELLSPQPIAQQSAYSGDPIVLARFSALLEQGLDKTSKKITGDQKQLFQVLGSRINAIENKLDTTVGRTNPNTDRICHLEASLEEPLAKTDDLENRSRRYIFRIHGFLESITDAQEATTALLTSLLPESPFPQTGAGPCSQSTHGPAP